MIGAEIGAMAVYRLFRSEAFEPEAISVMSGAYAEVCRSLGLRESDDFQANAVARKVIEFAQRGVRSRIDLRDQVLAAMENARALGCEPG
jgi:hypothetical protein